MFGERKGIGENKQNALGPEGRVDTIETRSSRDDGDVMGYCWLGRMSGGEYLACGLSATCRRSNA